MEDEFTKDDRCGVGRFATDETDPFYWACRMHDRDYRQAEGAEDVRKANQRFYAYMWRLVQRAPWHERPLLAARAAAYQGLVMFCGWSFFRIKRLK